MSSISSKSSSTVTQPKSSHPSIQSPAPNPSSRIPVTPAVLRSIFASSRTPYEERSISRIAFFRFTGFLFSCVCISFAAARGRGIKGGAGLLGVV
ncbi:hypothetical protein BJ138DRAFT_1143948 [Hygrophoropsis aurantiaca]|uniref:Uncharacterized protein n=1 Tax=Hygrophoropsis aurantiaca TaxID=72124 RepID=A0ACB8APB1_9AGAM|nr:hypothetical protein BJ138DRAFT_1143948 [Hygrophoropsis aurantiaca]